jgi:hypothetical protein
MYDVYGTSTLAKAAQKNILDPMKREHINSTIDSTTVGRFNEEDYSLTPCRFSKSGWKYVKKSD